MSILNYTYPMLLRVDSHSEWYRRSIHISFKLSEPKCDFGTLYLGGNGPYINVSQKAAIGFPIGSLHECNGIIKSEFDEIVLIEIQGYGSGVSYTICKKDLDYKKLLPPVKRINFLEKIRNIFWSL